MSEDWVFPENWDEMPHIEKVRLYADVIDKYSGEPAGGMGPIGIYPKDKFDPEKHSIKPYPQRDELKPYFERTLEEENGELLKDLHFLGNTLQYGADGNSVTFPWKPSSELSAFSSSNRDKIEIENIETCLDYFESDKEKNIRDKHNSRVIDRAREVVMKRNLPLLAGIPETKVDDTTLGNMLNDILEESPNSNKVLKMVTGEWKWNDERFKDIGYIRSFPGV